MEKHYISGLIFAISYCFSTAISDVLINIFLVDNSTFALAFVVFLVSASIFLLSAVIKHGFTWLARIPTLYRPILLINVMTLFGWLGAFISLKYLTPSISASIYMLSIPFFSILLEHKYRIPRHYSVLIIVIFTVIGLLVVFEVGKDGFDVDFITGLLATLIGGFGAAASLVYTKSLINQGFSVSQSLAIRFLLLVVAAFLLTSRVDINQLFAYTSLFNLLGFSFIVLIVPVFLMTKAIAYLTVTRAVIIASSVPFLTYIVQFILKSEAFDAINFVLTLIASIVLIYKEFSLQRTP